MEIATTSTWTPGSRGLAAGRTFTILSIFGVVPESITFKEGHTGSYNIEAGNVSCGRVTGASSFIAS